MEKEKRQQKKSLLFLLLERGKGEEGGKHPDNKKKTGETRHQGCKKTTDDRALRITRTRVRKKNRGRQHNSPGTGLREKNWELQLRKKTEKSQNWWTAQGWEEKEKGQKGIRQKSMKP